MSTCGGNLKAKHIVFTNIAKWDPFYGESNNVQMLESTLREVFETAEVEMDASSLSFSTMSLSSWPI
jgi:O-acetyl-ADP-ribose deacetylase (regulator of RNase III)